MLSSAFFSGIAVVSAYLMISIMYWRRTVSMFLLLVFPTLASLHWSMHSDAIICIKVCIIKILIIQLSMDLVVITVVDWIFNFSFCKHISLNNLMSYFYTLCIHDFYNILLSCIKRCIYLCCIIYNNMY